MRLERIQEIVPFLVALITGTIVALVSGALVGAGGAPFVFIGIFLTALVALAIWAKERIWLLIPLTFPLIGKVSILPLPFSVRDLCVMFCFTSYLVLYALKRLRQKPKFDLLDGLAVANIFYLITVFLQHPSGVAALSGGMVGGKAYFDAGIGFLAYLILSRAPADTRLLRLLPTAGLGGHVFHALLGLFLRALPSAITYVAPFYIAPLVSEAFSQTVETLGPERAELGRIGVLAPLGTGIFLILASFFRPMTLLLPTKPLRFFSALLSVALVLLSGFRSAILQLGTYTVLSSGFRRLWKDLVIISIVGTLSLGFLCLGQGRIFNLPLAAQRALSFLPGEWSYLAKSDAEGSIEWRVQMWEMVFSDSNWIQNWWFGDGFGFSRHELNIMQSETGFLGGSQQEAFLITGVFHNGILSGIRYAGVVGLCLFLWLFFYQAYRYFRLVKLARGTEFFPYVLMGAMPTIYGAANYVFVYGAYDSQMPILLMSCGMIKLLEGFVQVGDDRKGTDVIKKPFGKANTRSFATAGTAGKAGLSSGVRAIPDRRTHAKQSRQTHRVN